MPTYTVQDTETNKKVTFEWSGKKPPTDADMIEVFAAARANNNVPEYQEPQQGKNNILEGGMPSAVPSLETAANLATSSYGIPAAGLAGLFSLLDKPVLTKSPDGSIRFEQKQSNLSEARDIVEKTQEALVYQPQTKGGKQLTESVAYPVQKLDQFGAHVGKKLEETKHPNIGAAVHSTIAGIPVVVAGGKMALRRTVPQTVAKLNKKIDVAIDKGVNKAIRPSVMKKETHGQVVRYRNKARIAIKEIVENKKNLNIIDEKTGAKIEGLPKTLDQFSQAIEQTKKNIFEQYDNLAKKTGKIGVKINLKSISNELNPVIKNKILQDLSPETIKYAQSRIDVMTERGFYTAMETQEAIQLLNQTLKQFYKDPSPANKGMAYVDSLIANNLRKNLDKSIKRVTGKDYQALKSKYAALRTLETDVTKRSIVDARKNVKGLIDFSDVFTGYHIIHGVLKAEPSVIGAGITAKGIAKYMKLMNDPNRIVKHMFGDVEKLVRKQGGQ